MIYLEGFGRKDYYYCIKYLKNNTLIGKNLKDISTLYNNWNKYRVEGTNYVKKKKKIRSNKSKKKWIDWYRN